MVRGKLKKLLCIVFSLLFVGLLAACDTGEGGAKDYGDPNANTEVPASSVTLEIPKDGNGKDVIFVGAELDPYWFSQNAGRTIIDEEAGENYLIEGEVFNELFVGRIAEMGIKFFRMMFLTSWYCPDEASYTSKNYDWDSEQMESVYAMLDVAQNYGIEVCATMWLWDSDFMKVNPENDWSLCTDHAVFAEVCADLVDYLINERGYTCIKYFTPVNEPTSTFPLTYDAPNAMFVYSDYVEMCVAMDEAFEEAGVRDDVQFILSDDTMNLTWLEETGKQLSEVADILNSHNYSYTLEDSNAHMSGEGYDQNFKAFADKANEYGKAHVFGEFGTNNPNREEFRSPERGLQVARIALNMFNAGSQGMSYWVLFNEFYFVEEDESSSSMNTTMGLWGSADEGYACRPVYYSYSMLTRFVRKGMDIYTIDIEDEDLMAVAFSDGENWTYCVVNTAESEKEVSFLNRNLFPQHMARYVYDMNNVPTDNRVIGANGWLGCDGRVLTDTLPAQSFTVYTTLEG